jgi:hypothetical protein
MTLCEMAEVYDESLLREAITCHTNYYGYDFSASLYRLKFISVRSFSLFNHMPCGNCNYGYNNIFCFMSVVNCIDWKSIK